MVRQRIFEGARKWIGPWEGFVFILLRRNLRYFIFWRTSPPDKQISSHLTTTTLCPLSNSLAKIEDNLPSIWWRASTTILFAEIPEPDTIFSLYSLSRALSNWAAARVFSAVVFPVQFIWWWWWRRRKERKWAVDLYMFFGPISAFFSTYSIVYGLFKSWFRKKYIFNKLIILMLGTLMKIVFTKMYFTWIYESIDIHSTL